MARLMQLEVCVLLSALAGCTRFNHSKVYPATPTSLSTALDSVASRPAVTAAMRPVSYHGQPFDDSTTLVVTTRIERLPPVESPDAFSARLADPAGEIWIESSQPFRDPYTQPPSLTNEPFLGSITPGAAEYQATVPSELEPPLSALDSPSLWEDIVSDHLNFYSPRSLANLAVGIGIGAVLANTPADENFNHFYQENVRDAATDEWFEKLHQPKTIGDGMVTVPIFAGAACADLLFPLSSHAPYVGEWGRRSMRTSLVGFPAMLAMQKITGGSRPHELPGEGSEWHMFGDNNAVSGHSFMGAIPFITAAKMTDEPLFKVGLYFASTLAGLSRLNDEDHYGSQVMLGWWMAYIAATAVDETERPDRRLTLVPWILPNGGGGMALIYRW